MFAVSGAMSRAVCHAGGCGCCCQGTSGGGAPTAADGALVRGAAAPRYSGHRVVLLVGAVGSVGAVVER